MVCQALAQAKCLQPLHKMLQDSESTAAEHVRIRLFVVSLVFTRFLIEKILTRLPL